MANSTPRPALPHARASSDMGSDLGGPFDRPPGDPDGPGGWWILDEPEIHLGQDVVVPDLAGWRRERVPRLPNAPFFDVAPDWACEVVSPATVGVDRVRKMRLYAREAVRHLWLVDPILKTLEIYHLEEGRWFVVGTHADREVVPAEPFESQPLAIDRWWLED